MSDYLQHTKKDSSHNNITLFSSHSNFYKKKNNYKKETKTTILKTVHSHNAIKSISLNYRNIFLQHSK